MTLWCLSLHKIYSKKIKNRTEHIVYLHLRKLERNSDKYRAVGQLVPSEESSKQFDYFTTTLHFNSLLLLYFFRYSFVNMGQKRKGKAREQPWFKSSGTKAMSRRTTPGSMGRYTLPHSERASSSALAACR